MSEWLEKVKARRGAMHPRELWHENWPTLAADLDQLISDADNWFAYLRWRAEQDREIDAEGGDDVNEWRPGYRHCVKDTPQCSGWECIWCGERFATWPSDNEECLGPPREGGGS